MRSADVRGPMRLRLAAAFAVAAVMAVPATAGAATKEVGMGLAPKAAKAIQKTGADSNNFYPRTVSIHVGDTVAFEPYGFHNVDLPKRGGKPISLIVPGAPAAGVVDAAGAPFWFNGQLPTLGFNPQVLKPSFGKTVRFSGAAAVNSGLPLQERPKPFKVKFTRKGTFTFYCDIHPGMKGQVKVKARRAHISTAKQDARALKRLVSLDTKAAKSLAGTKAPANTVYLGAGKRGVDYFGMVPRNLTVPAGTTVEFKMHPGSRETHTATFGPGNADPQKDPSSYLAQLASTFEGPGPFDARATNPSDPPSAVATLTAASHGNGFWSSGLLDAEASSPLPVAAKVTFGQAGTYNYYCLLHPFMAGTVTVQ
jgi:plastocyanin